MGESNKVGAEAKGARRHLIERVAGQLDEIEKTVRGRAAGPTRLRKRTRNEIAYRDAARDRDESRE
jgi:hypothetical protein